MSTFLKTVPLLVEDTAVSQTTTIDPISGEPAVRVTGEVTTSGAWTSTQAADVTLATNDIHTNTAALETAVGAKTDPDTEDSVIGLLKRIVSNLS